MQSTKLLYYLGNTLIGLSLFGFVFLFAPILWIYLFPTHLTPLQDLSGFSITIPKIHAQAHIIEQVDPWNQAVYDKALEKGVAQAKGTAYPGENGTIFLFAHSSEAPWELTETNIPFLRLGELQNNDQIYLVWNKKTYIYKVYMKKEIWPTDTQYLTHLSKTQLILQTCTPIGTSLERLLVFAVPV